MKGFRFFSILIAVSTVMHLGFSTPSAAAPDETSGVFTLSGITPDLPTADLEPFGKIARQASVVGLGESVHTSRGYYVAKFRLIKYLVEKEGYRVFGMETPWIGALPASQFVESCTGNATAAAQSIFKVFQDTSTRDLFQWLCEFNREHPYDKVTFYGYDIQEVEPYQIVLSHLKNKGLDPDGSLDKAIRRCVGSAFKTSFDFFMSPVSAAIYSGKPISAEDHKVCMAGLARAKPLFKEFNAQRALNSSEAFQLMLERTSNNDFVSSFEARDEGMATNFAAFHAQAGAHKKAVNWAHNAHLNQDVLRIPNGAGTNYLIKPMGARLKRIYGDSYMAFAISGYHVVINWPGAQDHYKPYPIVSWSLESQLHASGYSYAFVDLAGSWLTPGQQYYFRDGEFEIPASLYRGIFYIDETLGNIYVK